MKLCWENQQQKFWMCMHAWHRKCHFAAEANWGPKLRKGKPSLNEKIFWGHNPIRGLGQGPYRGASPPFIRCSANFQWVQMFNSHSSLKRKILLKSKMAILTEPRSINFKTDFAFKAERNLTMNTIKNPALWITRHKSKMLSTSALLS